MGEMIPPRAAARLVAMCAGPQRRDDVLGDLAEEFRAGKSRGWYWRQAIGSAIPLLAARWIRWEGLRGATGVLIGYICVAALVIGADLTLGRLLPTALLSAFNVVSGFWFLILGGWMAAAIGGRRDARHGFWFMIALGVMNAVFWYTSRGEEPVWSKIGLTLIVPAGAWLGAKLREWQLAT